MTTFVSLGLIEPLQRALDAQSYTEPTPIQAQSIPPLLEGRDVLGCAQTGTGKTAAFALPILQHLTNNPRRGKRVVRALVLSPTRELAAQIGDSINDYARYLDLRHYVIFGGVGYTPQVDTLRRGVDILVATPGRLLDLQQQGHLDLSQVEFFVLDEADRMLDMGFIHDIRKVLKLLPTDRQNLLFSATMPDSIAALANSFLRSPVRVEVTPQSTTVERIDQRVMFVDKTNKVELLVDLLAQLDSDRIILFSRTRHGANKLVQQLERYNITAEAIHGNKSQSARKRALDGFRDGTVTLLIATDIAARGIDVDLVTHVVNYELPEVPEAYVHRIGRTARAGASGTAISLCDAAERDLLRGIERVTRQKIPHEDRRNDPAIVADKTPAHRNDGQPMNGARRGGPQRHNGGAHNGNTRNGSARNGGDRRRNERPAEHAGERSETRSARPARTRVDDTRANAHGQRPASNGHRPHKPREDRGRSESEAGATKARGSNGSGLHHVGFLARSTRGGDARPRKQGFGARPNRDAG